jgi:superfamily II DNA/RNA helicase
MLDMGFYDDIVKIINYLPKERQTVLFSATMPPKIRTLANKILRQPTEINISIAKPAAGILQQAFVVYDAQKAALLKHVLKSSEWNSVLIFASTKETVKKLDSAFQRAGLPAKAFHSDLEQPEREAILRAFKNKQINMIIGTDVLSRGIDVEGISLVINYDVPPDPEDYVHRVGRTARAETTGTAITFINERDQRKFHSIETLIGNSIIKLSMPVDVGTGPTYDPKAKRNGDSRGKQRGQGNRNRARKPR